MNKFCIKDGYIENNQTITDDSFTGVNYWNGENIKKSTFYQFYTYDYARIIVSKKKISRLLDIGCGIGSKLYDLHIRNPEVRITGIDQDYTIEYNKQHYQGITWFVTNLNQPNFGADRQKYDLVVLSDVIEHLRNPDLVMQEVKHVLTKDGFLIISTPERNVMRGKNVNYSPNKYHVREWNNTELKCYLIKLGFYIVNSKLQYPVRIGFNKYFFKEMIGCVKRIKRLKYSQLILASVK